MATRSTANPHRENAVRVLIADDSSLARAIIRQALRGAPGIQVVGLATNGEEAVKLAAELKPDVITMDIHMPKVDGIEATRRIQVVRPTPIVVLTAYGSREMLERATEAGVGAYLTKPTNPSSLQNAITTVVARFSDMMELRRLNDQLQEEITVRKRMEEARARLLRDEREQRVMAETLTEVTLALTSQTRLEMVLGEILNQAQRIVPFRSATIMLLEGSILRNKYWQGYEGDEAVIANMELPLDEFAVNAEVVHSRVPLIISDVRKDPRWIILEATSWIRSVLMVPICLHQRVLGILNLDSAVPDAFTEEDAKRLMPLASAAGIAIENARLMEDLEAEVAARTAEIVAERDKSEAILRSTADAIAVLDEALRVQYVNPAFEQLTGYTYKESAGQVIHTLLKSTLSQQSMQEMRAAYEAAVEWRGEPVVQRKDGRMYEAAMTIAPIRDGGGALLGHVVSHQDISRFKALDRARSQFITSISHELRTPLTVLDLSVRKLQRQAPPDSDQRSLSAMAIQISQLIRFTEDILEMAALDSGKSIRTWDSIQLVALVLDTVRRFHRFAATQGVTVTARPIPVDLPEVKGDPKRVAQMLAELVENAITFTPSGGQVTTEVKVVEDEARTWVTISVQDTGPGVLPEEREKVFDRFFRGHLAESGNILGTGLGLSIAQEIARSHGGKITLESVVGKGSNFTIWLPKFG